MDMTHECICIWQKRKGKKEMMKGRNIQYAKMKTAGVNITDVNVRFFYGSVRVSAQGGRRNIKQLGIKENQKKI